MTLLPAETPKKPGLVIDLDVCVGCKHRERMKEGVR